jgi:hypothetical protein
VTHWDVYRVGVDWVEEHRVLAWTVVAVMCAVTVWLAVVLSGGRAAVA